MLYRIVQIFHLVMAQTTKQLPLRREGFAVTNWQQLLVCTHR